MFFCIPCNNTSKESKEVYKQKNSHLTSSYLQSYHPFNANLSNSEQQSELIKVEECDDISPTQNSANISKKFAKKELTMNMETIKEQTDISEMRDELMEEFEEEKNSFEQQSENSFSSESSDDSILVKRFQEFQNNMNSSDYLFNEKHNKDGQNKKENKNLNNGKLLKASSSKL